VVDVVGAGVLEDRAGDVRRLEDLERDPVLFEAEGLGPVAQLHEAVEVLVPALLVERLVERDAVVLEDVQAGDTRVGDGLEDAAERRPDRLEEGLGALGEVDGDGDHRRRRDLRGDVGAARRRGRALLEAAPERGPPRVAPELLRAPGELELRGMGQVER